MARVRKTTDYEPLPEYAPPMTLEDQEDQLITLAVDLAVKRLREGTASNQLVAEIIKMGTAKERLAKEKLQRENELLKAKAEAMKASETAKEMYTKAIQAMRLYSGVQAEYDSDEDEDY